MTLIEKSDLLPLEGWAVKLRTLAKRLMYDAMAVFLVAWVFLETSRSTEFSPSPVPKHHNRWMLALAMATVFTLTILAYLRLKGWMWWL